MVELLSEVRKIKQNLKAKSQDVLNSLAALEEGDRAIQWEGVAAEHIDVSRALPVLTHSKS